MKFTFPARKPSKEYEEKEHKNSYVEKITGVFSEYLHKNTNS